MFKKILFISLVSFSLLFGMAGECLADVSAQLEQAVTYEKSGNYQQAEEIYKTIVVTDYPGDYALKAQRNLTRLYIAVGNDTRAQEALDKLIADFSEHSGLPAALHDIARRLSVYKGTEKYEEAKNIYRRIIQQYPDSPYASRAQVDIPKTDVLSLIDSGNDSEAQAAIDKLTSDFSGHWGLPAALYDIAREYEWSGKYEKAESMYRQIAQQYADSSYGGKAPVDAARTNVLSIVDSGEDSEALAALDRLVADFQGHPRLPITVTVIGEVYYREAFWGLSEGLDIEAKDHFTKALTVWARIIQELPPSAFTPQAYFYSADCYRRLGEYEKAIEYCKEIVDNWPDYKYAWEAQFMIDHRVKDVQRFNP